MFYITQKNWDKILGYAEEAYVKHKSEIGGMSVMIRDKDGDWELQDPVILKQEISSGNTVLEKDALAVYYTKQAKKMGKNDFRFCWWHSHHTMSAFWSNTDIKAIEEFNDGDFSFALVVNLKNEYKFRVSVWNPVEIHEDVELEILKPRRSSKFIAKEVEKLCEKPTTAIQSWANRGNSYSPYSSQRQERLPLDIETYNASYDLDTDMTYADILEEVDTIVSEVIEGSMLYPEYSQIIDELNTKLAAENSIHTVIKVTETQLQSLLYVLPNQLIKYKNNTSDTVDDFNTYRGWH